MNTLSGDLKIQQDQKIAVVTARFNSLVTEKLVAGAKDAFFRHGGQEENLELAWVPGAFEIPLIAKKLAQLNRFSAIICLGAVIRGETSHYDYVCNAVERGCSELQLRTGQPVVFGVLTTEDEAQAFDRIGGNHGHKGVESAQVLVEMLNLKNQITP